MLIPVILTVAALLAGSGSTPEFFLLGNHCVTTVASLLDMDMPPKTIEGTPFRFACDKSAEQVTCVMQAADGNPGIKGDDATFTILVDSPPELLFRDEHGGDFVAVNLTSHAFVMITRMLDDKFAGSKVCQGAYLTASEAKLLEDKK